MKRAIVLLAVVLVLFGTVLPSPAWAGGSWRGGYHSGHGGWWWPGAIIGGLALGAVAIVTAPFWALSAPPAYSPPVAYVPPVAYAPPPAYSVPPAYAPPPYQQAPTYAPPPAPAVQREVVYSNGRYVLYGDGVRQPWQWVWVPSAPPPPPPHP
jgi:hypothetical protein